MVITEDFLRSEIADLEREMNNAREFLIKAQAAIDVHNMLLNRLNTQGTEPDGNLPTSSEARN